MAKKDFGAISTERATGGELLQTAQEVLGKVATATSRKGQQGDVTPKEAAERASALKTQGRKGCKAVRINMAFTPENHEFVKLIARAKGLTMTEFTNNIIQQYREDNPELMEKAQAFIDSL